MRYAAGMRSSIALLVIVAGCATHGPSGIAGDRVFEEHSGAWPRLSKVRLCDNGRFSIDTAVEVNSDVGTFVQDPARAEAVTGTATGASTELHHTPITFHYTIALGDPNVLSSPELTGAWEQLGDSGSEQAATEDCALVATFP